MGSLDQPFRPLTLRAKGPKLSLRSTCARVPLMSSAQRNGGPKITFGPHRVFLGTYHDFTYISYAYTYYLTRINYKHFEYQAVH